jgi:surface carbohydrate biosynthesis protein
VRTVVLQIDEAPRDFLGLTLCAMHLLGRGLRVVISDRSLPVLEKVFPHAVFMGKAGLRFATTFEGTLAVHPTEGAHFLELGWEETVLDKYFANAMVKVSPEVIFVWGAQQVEILRNFDPALADKLMLTGAQRLDLCLEENHWLSNHARALIQEEFHDFVLLVTRFTTVNNDDPKKLTTKLKGRGDGFSRLEIAINRLAQDSVDLGMFVTLMHRLVIEFPECNFVIRPHPSENRELYEAFFGQFQNVVITREGNLMPWILASKLVVTCSSTSAVEASLAGIPVVNFSSSALPPNGQTISVACEAGTVVHSIDEAAAACSLVLRGESKSEQVWSSRARRRLENLNEHQATPLIAATLAELAKSKPLTRLPSLRLLGSLRKTGDHWKTAHSLPLGATAGFSRDEVRRLFREAPLHGYPMGRMLWSSFGTFVFECDTAQWALSQVKSARGRD